MLDSRVFSLGVFSDEDAVDVLVGCLEALDGLAGSYVGVEPECPSQGQVERDMPFANGSSQRAFQCDGVLLDRFDGYERRKAGREQYLLSGTDI